jgi:hypothetical protein
MKMLMFAFMTVAVVSALQAQNPHVTTDTTSKKPRGTIQMSNGFLKPGSFSHSTSKGDIYVLPYDNMPCLVADTQQMAPMPVSIHKVPPDKMPNATPRREMIPRKKED